MLRFIQTNLRWLAAGLALCFFSGFGQTYFISLSNESIRTALGLSHSGFGLAYALATLASAIVVSQLGYLADRWSARKSAIVVLLGLAFACVLMSLSTFSVFILGPAIFGLRLFGQGFCGHVAMTSAGKWFLTNRGKAVSIVGLGFPLSEAIMPAIAASTIAVLGFSALWAGGSAVIVLIALPMLILLLRQEREPHAIMNIADDQKSAEVEAVLDWTRKQVSRRPEFYFILMAVLCPPFMVTAFFFHQQHMADIKDWSSAAMVASMVPFAIAQVISSLTVGWAIDRLNARVILSVYLVPMAAALILQLVFAYPRLVPVYYVLIGLSAGGAASLLGALWPELFGTRFLGEIRALAYAAMVASTAASPFLTGFLIDLGIRFDIQLAFMGAFCLLASVTMFLIQPRLAVLNAKIQTLNS